MKEVMLLMWVFWGPRADRRAHSPNINSLNVLCEYKTCIDGSVAANIHCMLVIRRDAHWIQRNGPHGGCMAASPHHRITGAWLQAVSPRMDFDVTWRVNLIGCINCDKSLTSFPWRQHDAVRMGRVRSRQQAGLN